MQTASAAPKLHQLITRLSIPLRRRGVWIFLSAVALLGFAAGYRLSGLLKLETYKLLNVAGLSYDLLGVLVLSELLASTPKWKSLCVKYLAPGVVWFHILFPGAAFIGSLIAIFMRRPSSGTAAQFFLSFTVYALWPTSICGEMVVSPRLPFVKRDIETRWRSFGLILLLTGVGLQLIVAIEAVVH